MGRSLDQNVWLLNQVVSNDGELEVVFRRTMPVEVRRSEEAIPDVILAEVASCVHSFFTRRAWATPNVDRALSVVPDTVVTGKERLEGFWISG
jgi:hypothetical protein